MPKFLSEGAIVNQGSGTIESTLDLLHDVRQGNSEAVNRLCARYLPSLRRWARGRLPGYARDLRDTEDLVQETMFQTLRHLHGFDHKGRGALQAYLRQGVINRIRDEVRRASRRSLTSELPLEHPDDAASPEIVARDREAFRRYREALARLRPDEQTAVTLRLERGCDYAHIATALGKDSPDAARMTVNRALRRLTAIMQSAGA